MATPLAGSLKEIDRNHKSGKVGPFELIRMKSEDLKKIVIVDMFSGGI